MQRKGRLYKPLVMQSSASDLAAPADSAPAASSGSSYPTAAPAYSNSGYPYPSDYSSTAYSSGLHAQTPMAGSPAPAYHPYQVWLYPDGNYYMNGQRIPQELATQFTQYGPSLFPQHFSTTYSQASTGSAGMSISLQQQYDQRHLAQQPSQSTAVPMDTSDLADTLEQPGVGAGSGSGSAAGSGEFYPQIQSALAETPAQPPLEAQLVEVLPAIALESTSSSASSLQQQQAAAPEIAIPSSVPVPPRVEFNESSKSHKKSNQGAVCEFMANFIKHCQDAAKAATDPSNVRAYDVFEALKKARVKTFPEGNEASLLQAGPKNTYEFILNDWKKISNEAIPLRVEIRHNKKTGLQLTFSTFTSEVSTKKWFSLTIDPHNNMTCNLERKRSPDENKLVAEMGELFCVTRKPAKTAKKPASANKSKEAKAEKKPTALKKMQDILVPGIAPAPLPIIPDNVLTFSQHLKAPIQTHGKRKAEAPATGESPTKKAKHKHPAQASETELAWEEKGKTPETALSWNEWTGLTSEINKTDLPLDARLAVLFKYASREEYIDTAPQIENKPKPVYIHPTQRYTQHVTFPSGQKLIIQFKPTRLFHQQAFVGDPECSSWIFPAPEIKDPTSDFKEPYYDFRAYLGTVDPKNEIYRDSGKTLEAELHSVHAVKGYNGETILEFYRVLHLLLHRNKTYLVDDSKFEGFDDKGNRLYRIALRLVRKVPYYTDKDKYNRDKLPNVRLMSGGLASSFNGFIFQNEKFYWKARENYRNYKLKDLFTALAEQSHFNKITSPQDLQKMKKSKKVKEFKVDVSVKVSFFFDKTPDIQTKLETFNSIKIAATIKPELTYKKLKALFENKDQSELITHLRKEAGCGFLPWLVFLANQFLNIPIDENKSLASQNPFIDNQFSVGDLIDAIYNASKEPKWIKSGTHSPALITLMFLLTDGISVFDREYLYSFDDNERILSFKKDIYEVLWNGYIWESILEQKPVIESKEAKTEVLQVGSQQFFLPPASASSSSGVAAHEAVAQAIVMTHHSQQADEDAVMPQAKDRVPQVSAASASGGAALPQASSSSQQQAAVPMDTSSDSDKVETAARSLLEQMTHLVLPPASLKPGF